MEANMRIIGAVLSFDPKKVWLSEEYGSWVIKKRTTSQEHEQWKLANSYLQKYRVVLSGGAVQVYTAPILDWDDSDGIITTKLCGTNLEYILKSTTGETRKMLLSLLRDFFIQIRNQGFLWGEPAPRNMILDRQFANIFLVDFERPLQVTHEIVPSQFFNRYIRTYAQEEFACLLLKHEQETLLDEFLVKEFDRQIALEEIHSKRKKSLLGMLYGQSDSYHINQIQEVERIMADIATPFWIEERIFYPMQIIDVMSAKGGPNVYADFAIRLFSLDECSRHRLLCREATRLGICFDEI